MTTQQDTAVAEQRGNLPEAVEKIDTTHNLTIRQLCQMLKADRHWVNQYIVARFKDDIVRLGTGYGTGAKTAGKKCRTNWAYLVWRKHKFTPKVECVFLPKQKIIDFINANVIAVTRQTASIRLSMCIATEKRNEFFKTFKSLRDRYNAAYEKLQKEHEQFMAGQNEFLKSIENLPAEAHTAAVNFYTAKMEKEHDEYDVKIDNLCKKYADHRNELEKQYFTEAAIAALDLADTGSTKRGQIPAVTAQLPEKWYENSRTVADILHYGDTYEMVYRDLFNEGAVRIELALPDPADPEKRSKKVYYYRNEETLPVPPAFQGYEDYDDIMLATAEFASKFYAI